MKILQGRLFFTVMLAVASVYILYVTYTNLIHDPEATAFLSRKINPNHPLNIPVWLKVMHIHVVCACLAMVAGAINFSTGIRRRYRTFHRVNGYLYILAVFLVCVTSGYMAPYSTGGRINSMAFNLINIGWFAMTIVALIQIKRKQLDKHRNWMIRSYVFCFTNMFIHLIEYVLHIGLGIGYELSYTIGVYGTIVLNVVLAELVIRAIHPMNWGKGHV